MKTNTALALAAALVTVAAPAFAQSKGDFTIGLGVHSVNPDSSDSVTAAGPIDVDASIRPTITAEYFVRDNLGVELLASWPFEHDINLAGTGKIGRTKQLPPTLSLQYHFANNSRMTPFLGVGVNYTNFFDESSSGALAGTPISLDDSWGIALHAGIDFDISERDALRADVRWIDIDTDATVGGAPIGEVNIDPWIVGVAYVRTF